MLGEASRSEREPVTDPRSVFEGGLSVVESVEPKWKDLPQLAKDWFGKKYKETPGYVSDKIESMKKWAEKTKEEQLKKLTPTGMWKEAKKITRFGLDLIPVGVALTKNMVLGLWDFAKLLIKKQGNVSFSEGFEIGEKLFDFNDKKGEKK